MRSVALHLNAALMHLDITLGTHLLHFRCHRLRISAEIRYNINVALNATNDCQTTRPVVTVLYA